MLNCIRSTQTWSKFRDNTQKARRTRTESEFRDAIAGLNLHIGVFDVVDELADDNKSHQYPASLLKDAQERVMYLKLSFGLEREDGVADVASRPP